MAEKINQQAGVEAQLIEGRGGVFDVVVDGRKIFSKREAGRFPESDEIIRQLSPIS